MGLLTHLLIGILHLAMAATEICLVFVVARSLSQVWSNQYLLAFNAAGRPLVDALLRAADNQMRRFHSGTPKRGITVNVCLIALICVWFVVRGLIVLMT